MELNIYKFIIKHSLRQQIILTILSLASFIPYYYYLSIPKAIVNQGISGKGIKFPVDIWGLGLAHLDQTNYLFLLTFVFMLLVVVQQGFKYAINVFQGISGERMLRRLRYDLYAQILRFPLPTFRKMSQGEIIPMITAEVEPLGGFIAESFATPIFQGGMLLVTFIFLVIQNWIMALAAVALYPIQFYVIPKLQRRVKALGKERIKNQRRLADRIGETISGVQEIHAHHGSGRMLAEFSRRLGFSYWIRYELYQRKFVVKFINNFLQQLGPFFFYSIGGYLVIKGELDVGTIVAAVAAHKEMSAPWKELLNHYQNLQDAQIKYAQVIVQFEQPGMREPQLLTGEPETIEPLAGDLALSNVTLAGDQGDNIIDGITLTLPLRSRVAVVGSYGRDEFLQLIARLMDPTRGRVSVNGTDLATVPEAVLGRRIGYVGHAAFMFNSTLGDNLFFGLRHKPMIAPDYTPEQLTKFNREIHEAIASGNTVDDFDADWTEYAAAGATDRASLNATALAVLRQVNMYDEVYQFGLRGAIDPAKQPDMAKLILQARTTFRERLRADDIGDLVEGWDRSKYNSNATVAENLMFGTATNAVFDAERMAENKYVLEVLDKVGLKDRFLRIGYEIASTMVELFADLPPDHEFFQQFSFISSDDLPDFQAIIARATVETVAQLPAAERNRLLSLPFKVIPARHRLGHIDEEVQAGILKAREVFATDLPDHLKDAVAFFDPKNYTATANIQDNILFGKVAYGQAQAVEKVGRMLASVIDEMQLRDRVAEVGLAFEVGIGGTRLAVAQRQKLAIARALIKRPDLLLLSESTAVLDTASHVAIMDTLLKEFEGRGLIWSLHRTQDASRFDRVLVFEAGRISEQGTFDELNQDGHKLKELLVHA